MHRRVAQCGAIDPYACLSQMRSTPPIKRPHTVSRRQHPAQRHLPKTTFSPSSDGTGPGPVVIRNCVFRNPLLALRSLSSSLAPSASETVPAGRSAFRVQLSVRFSSIELL